MRDGEGSEQDESHSGGESYFADLLHEVENRFSIQHDDSSESGTANHDDLDVNRPHSDPLDRVRELIPEGLAPPSREPQSKDTPTNGSGHRKLYAGIILGIVLALLIPGVVIAVDSSLNGLLFDAGSSEYIGEDDTLYLQSADAAYMSRIFQETTHEVAYCGVVSRATGRHVLSVSVADTLSSSPEAVSFSTQNCPDGGRDVLLHTHPNGDIRLSQQDRETIATRPESIICVQGGPIEAGPGQATKNLACYLQTGTGEGELGLQRIRVIVQ